VAARTATALARIQSAELQQHAMEKSAEAMSDEELFSLPLDIQQAVAN
jgi:hypothetical protein